MSPIQTRLHVLEGFTVPDHLHEFAAISTGILDAAHAHSLQVDHAVHVASSEANTFMSYIERTRVEHPLDYEKFAVRLGQQALSISFDHRHVYGESIETADEWRYPRSTVVFQNDTAKIYRLGMRGPHDEDITENKEVGLEMTNHLHHTLGVLGVRYAATEPLMFARKAA
ncbi:MAG: hypothetical protein ACREGE_04560 [Candidatus Microsaccharimonas sp.]